MDRAAAQKEWAKKKALKKKRALDAEIQFAMSVLKLQSLFRGRQGRRLAVDKKETVGAAKKIQAIQRGKKARQEVEDLKMKKEMDELAGDPDAIAATTKIQAIQRGRLERKREQMERQEQAEAAKKIQKVHRGKQARKDREEQSKAAEKIQKVHRGKLARKERREQEEAAQKIQAIHRGKKTREKISALKDGTQNTKDDGPRDTKNEGGPIVMVRPQKSLMKFDEKDASSASRPAAMVMPKTLPEAMRVLREYQSREKDLVEIQKIQNTKMKTLKHKAETTVGQLAQEIDMLSTEMQEMRFALEQESKKTKQEGNLRRAAEQEAARLRREISSLKVEMREATTKQTRMTVENQRLEAILAKVGDGALDELEGRLRTSEEMRWKAEMEVEKLRAELNWQTNSRMDERLTVASLEDELQQARAEKRRGEMRKIQVEEALEQCLAQLRSKKRETSDMRKRIEMMISSNSKPNQHSRTSHDDQMRSNVVPPRGYKSSPERKAAPAQGSGSTRHAAYLMDGTIDPLAPSGPNRGKFLDSPKKAQVRRATELRKQIHTLQRPAAKGIDSYVDAYSTTKFPKKVGTGKSPDQQRRRKPGPQGWH